MIDPSPFIDLVPKDPLENLRWRQRMRERALVDSDFREAIRDAAMTDVLFFFNALCFCFEPRALVKIKPFCLASGTLVVTNRGPVPIQQLTVGDFVWDGESWVRHGGALCMGVKDVILAYGVYLTRDHQVRTSHGWKMACCGYDREGVRLPDGYRESWGLSMPNRSSREVAMSMPMREASCCGRRADAERQDEELRLHEGRGRSRARKGENSNSNILHLDGNAESMQVSIKSHVASLWRTWNKGVQALAQVCEFLGGHGRKATRHDAGSHRQRRELQAGQLSLGDMEGAAEQSIQQCTQKKAFVYDILNCGPSSAFTILGDDGRPLLVHNCTWPHQDPVILAMDKAIDDSERTEEPIDVLVDKSRGQGATWIYLLVFLRRWLRDPMFSAGLVTRTENLVDSAHDADALMWKVAWEIERLPFWMLPKDFNLARHRNLSNHTILNPENDALIAGYAASADVARGGRKTVFGIDELGATDFISGGKDYAVMDATFPVSNCRFLVSTFGSDAGAFFEAATQENNAVKCVMRWQDNPTQSKLLYRVVDGKAIASRPEEQKAVDAYYRKNREFLSRLERRGYQIESKDRSPWYDRQCARPGSTPRSIAKELDRNPKGAVGKAFPPELLETMRAKCVRPPLWQGKLVFDSETLEVKGLIAQDNGPLKLWFRPGAKSTDVPAGRFVIGCDISYGGTGDFSSNSAACGLEKDTGEQMLEYSAMGLTPTRFASVAVALSKWLHNAYLGWESSGPGAIFQKAVIEDLNYANVYWREVEEVGRRAKSRKPGWLNASDEAKGELFEAMAIGMESGGMIPRSEVLIRECGEYEWEKGKLVHRPSKTAGIDGKPHADCAIAGGVAWLCANDLGATDVDKRPESLQNAPYGSPAWRHQQDAERNAPPDDEDEFGLRELLGTHAW